MWMDQGVRTSVGHGGITCVLKTQFSSYFCYNIESSYYIESSSSNYLNRRQIGLESAKNAECWRQCIEGTENVDRWRQCHIKYHI